MSMFQSVFRTPVVALAGVLGLLGSVGVLANPHEIVSSDGTVVAVAEGSSSQGVNSSPGSQTAGARRDAESEFPASRLTAAEAAEFAELYRPVVPRYARTATRSEGAVAETVIGQDARYRIYPSQSGHPERAIGLITFNRGTGSFSCTGWLINSNTVATAGHCVHSGGPGGAFSTNVRFYPGRDGAVSPFGSCTARGLFTVAGWSALGQENFDYGAIKLNCTVGNTTGFFGFFWQIASLNGLPVQVSGYPGDKPSGTHWSGSGDIEVSEVSKTRYKIDTAGGQSGGPVFQTDRVGLFCTGVCANSIHAYGLSGGRNSATRINQPVFNNLIAWRNAP